MKINNTGMKASVPIESILQTNSAKITGRDKAITQ